MLINAEPVMIGVNTSRMSCPVYEKCLLNLWWVLEGAAEILILTDVFSPYRRVYLNWGFCLLSPFFFRGRFVGVAKSAPNVRTCRVRTQIPDARRQDVGTRLRVNVVISTAVVISPAGVVSWAFAYALRLALGFLN